MRKIFLYGPPGSGKTTIGKILAQNLQIEFLDVDQAIELSSGISISEIISARGEQAFREIETDTIRRICQQDSMEYFANTPGVVALGGGALLRPENRVLCENVGDIIFLDCDLSELIERLSRDDSHRPLLIGNLQEKLNALLSKRKEHYSSFNLRINNVDIYARNSADIQKKPDQIAWEIQKLLGRYHVQGMGAGYDVIVEPGGLNTIGLELKQRGMSGPIAIVCDENIEKLYAGLVTLSLERAGFGVRLVVIKAGEENKTLETVAYLWREFLSAGLDRKSTVLALGGGVVGDLAGFAAATYMRGCRWVAVPTTLLSMVDASLGGKTGFDLPEGKNLVGAFYSPRLVFADPNVLSTLPEEELKSGLAEVVKHGIISDPQLVEYCSKGFEMVKEQLPIIVRSAMGVKVKIIQEDPFELGIRAALNLGHTVGHAIEIVSKFRLRHGEAVAIGMVLEARLAEKLGLCQNGNELSEQIKAILAGLDLPTEIPLDLDISKIIQAMKIDKKKELDKVKFALPVAIGIVKYGVVIPDLEMAI